MVLFTGLFAVSAMISLSGNRILQPTDVCNGYQAYVVDIHDDISVNLPFEQGYNIYIDHKTGGYMSGAIKLQFEDVGCQYVDVMKVDINSNVSQNDKIWFNVGNNISKMNNLKVYFPQFGPDQCVVFERIDPLDVVVRLRLEAVIDGSIDKISWYYTTDSGNVVEEKIDSSNNLEHFFSIDINKLKENNIDIIQLGADVIDKNGKIYRSEFEMDPSLYISAKGKCIKNMGDPDDFDRAKNLSKQNLILTYLYFNYRYLIGGILLFLLTVIVFRYMRRKDY